MLGAVVGKLLVLYVVRRIIIDYKNLCSLLPYHNQVGQSLLVGTPKKSGYQKYPENGIMGVVNPGK